MSCAKSSERWIGSSVLGEPSMQGCHAAQQDTQCKQLGFGSLFAHIACESPPESTCNVTPSQTAGRPWKHLWSPGAGKIRLEHVPGQGSLCEIETPFSTGNTRWVGRTSRRDSTTQAERLENLCFQEPKTSCLCPETLSSWEALGGEILLQQVWPKKSPFPLKNVNCLLSSRDTQWPRLGKHFLLPQTQPSSIRLAKQIKITWQRL